MGARIRLWLGFPIFIIGSTIALLLRLRQFGDQINGHMNIMERSEFLNYYLDCLSFFKVCIL